MNLDNGQKEKINIAFEKVVVDLRNIFEASKLDEIFLATNLKIYNNILIIRKNKSFLRDTPYPDIEAHRIHLDKKHGEKYKIARIRESDYKQIIIFLENYEKVRQEFIDVINTRIEEEALERKRIDAIVTQCSKEVTKPSGIERSEEVVIEVEVPDSINQQTIEISEIDGKRQGRIKIGPVLFNILTSSNVQIVNKSEKEKVKRKRSIYDRIFSR